MIQLLATRYPKSIAYTFFLIFLSGFAPVYGGSNRRENYIPESRSSFESYIPGFDKTKSSFKNGNGVNNKIANNADGAAAFAKAPDTHIGVGFEKTDIGGPSQPEMSSFKSVGADNMVNLFTGDFSYNIPLMDVGGYPINIFYDGGITMEQEASWVGLGWNINPGTVSRNMRGVPDDFNGEDQSVQIQKVKPNITWGFNMAADMEFSGIKGFERFTGSLGASLGMAFNNYLGPALDFGIKGGLGFKATGKVASEKSADTTFGLKLNAGFAANANSRYGFTFSPNVSLTATNFANVRNLSTGLRLGTSYNSRSGIKQLQISEQMAYNFATAKYYDDKGVKMVFSGSSSIGQNILSTTISFAKPSYTPTLRMPLTNEAYAGHFQLGAGLFGGYVSGEVEGYYQKSSVTDGDVTQRKPMVGYLYYQNARNNQNAVMDFTRFNDNEVTNNTPIISAPQYSYDVFSIQGEGTGGSIRAYRNDHGYVRDNFTLSRDKSLSIGGDIGPPGHYGGNFNTIKTPTTIGEWGNGNLLRDTVKFGNAKGLAENVYFRNPGETSVLTDNQFEKIGGTDLVRYKLGGTDYTPIIEPVLEQFSKANKLIDTSSMLKADLSERKKRTQITSFLTADEARLVGLDTAIKNFNTISVLDGSNNLSFTNISRVSEYRKKHHISQINVTEADGKRYIYGVPVYNIRQKDFSFSVDDLEVAGEDDRVTFSRDETTVGSLHLPGNSTTKRDGFVQETETPAYAHSFLLSGLLSPDYVDVTGNGITEDDMGNAVKFNYTKVNTAHKWRTPLSPGTPFKANFNPGNLTESKDDKGLVSYGERESWYAHSIESKTMIALFTLEDRADGKGSIDSLMGVNSSDNSLKRLKKIDLYSKPDLKKNGLTGAKPVKTVWFAYSYTLCQGTPDNTTGGGKLTLDSIYFTFNGKNRASKNKYAFSYGNTASATENPGYAMNASDRWGNYKPKSFNPATQKNSEYPYSIQDKNQKTTIDKYASVWALKKILLPSGGQLEVEYEADDYAFVQNKRAADMMEIAGFGKDNSPMSSNLYSINFNSIVDNDKVYIKVQEECTSADEVYRKYLEGQTQLAFKLAVNMPKGMEYVTSYATVAEWGFVAGSPLIWVRLNAVDGMSPLVVTAIEFLREQLPGQAYAPGYDLSESDGLEKVVKMMKGLVSAFGEFLADPGNQFRQKRYAQTVSVAKSFVRLNDPDGYKYGGGHRVKSVKLKDNWKAMTNQYDSEYGQEYNYETTETFNGQERRISSGVASYEPSIGGEENPFQTIVQVANKLPLGPTSFGAIEMPVLDAFFPAPLVGYSKVTVRSLKRGDIPADKKSRSGIGKQVTEYYTAKDFPVYYNHTSFDKYSDKQEHKASLLSFFYKYAFDSRALSQGFIVETNDMHGKVKSQASYGESDTLTRINYTENFYRNTGSKGLNEKFDFIDTSKGGRIFPGNMGIDVELMTDTREFSVKSISMEIQGQLDLFPVFGVFPWLPFIWGVSGNSENTYRAVTTTKMINYHGILDSVVVIDKGSQVSTKNLVYDAETGSVVVNRTNNEFDQPVYSINYPAYWGYSGMGLAYKNIDAVYSGVKFRDGKITEGISSADLKKIFESGDELFLLNSGTAPAVPCGPSYTDTLLWVFDKNKNASSLTNTIPDLVFINKAGQLSNRDGVSFRIIRSGKRNMLSASLASVTSMNNPIATVSGTPKLVINNTIVANSANKVINATAVEYREKWQTDNDIIRKYVTITDPNTCISTEVEDCNGYLEKSTNPYRKGLLGNFRVNQSKVFYGNRADTITTATILKQNGYLKNFALYWNFSTANNLVPNITNSNWVWNSQITKFNSKGLELETRDALNIYTAAQYGYNKTVPVAVANNTRFEEMFYEGFEDKDYKEGINASPDNICAKRHIDFTGISNTQVVNTELLSFGAHSGKNVLKIDSNAIAVKTLPVKSAFVDSFSVIMKNDTIKSLYNTGGLLTKISAQPSNAPITAPTFTTSNLGMTLDFPTRNVTGEIVGNTVKYYMLYKTVQYTKITTPNTYSFNLATSQQDVPLGYPDEYIFNMSAISVSIKKANGDPVTSFSCYSTNSPQVRNVFLTCDTYLIETLCSVDIQRPYDGSGDGFHAFSADFSYTSNIGTTSYKTLDAQDICFFTKPVAATDSMINSTFSITSNKKMLFSAWVKENCDNRTVGTNCKSKVTLQYNGGSSQVDEFVPAGPIIEGWQRYEGVFTAPATVTQMTMNLVNNSSQPIYFDDIRIHPFNANMKSYVYDPVNLRLMAELDANNYATFYEYDEEGTLIRTKAETKEGVKTINETRSFKQKAVKEVVQQ